MALVGCRFLLSFRRALCTTLQRGACPSRDSKSPFRVRLGPLSKCIRLSHHEAAPCALPLVGRAAPEFEADAFMPSGAIEKVSLKQLLQRHDGVCLLFYPLNFTFVCPTELLAFSDKTAEFQKRNWALLGVSVDSAYSHGAWTRLPPSEGGVGTLPFPLVSDLSKRISRDYGLLANEAVALRGAVLIGKDGVVRHLAVNDLSMGRSVEETLRVADMIDHIRRNGDQVCPANWAKGKKALSPTRQGVKEYLTTHSKGSS